MEKMKLIGLALGLLLLGAALSQYLGTRSFLDGALLAQGRVVELVPVYSSDSTTYRPIVMFITRDGKEVEFSTTSSSNPPAYRQGESVELYYPPATPSAARLNGFFSLWGWSLLLAFAGVLFLLSNLRDMLRARRHDALTDELLRTGRRVEARVRAVELNEKRSRDGMHPFRIVAQWRHPDTRRIHLFRSEDIWFDPADHLITGVVDVLVDSHHPERYCMQLDFDIE